VGALYQESADDALDVFNHLTLMDAPNGPEMLGTLCRPWVTDIVTALFGALDPETKRRHISQLFICLSKKNGKALALDTPIPTPGGWTTIGAIRPGDYVFGANGTPVMVMAESEIFTDHECYRVNFSNGESVIADAGHLWQTTSLTDKKTKVLTTQEIAATISTRRDGARNHSIRIAQPLVLPDITLPIPPYTLGAWLGDGHTSSGVITTMDDGVLDAIRADGFVPSYRHNNGSKASSYAIHPGDRNFCKRGHDIASRRLHNDGKCLVCMRAWDKFHNHGTPMPPIVPRSFHELLRHNGLLDNKHIPSVYLRASHAQRLALLQGLMDTDGGVCKLGKVFAYTTKLKVLADGVSELLSSLGVKHSVNLRPSSIGGRIVGYYYTLQFFVCRDELPCFQLARKLDRMQISTKAKNSPRSKNVHITSAEIVATVPTKCICVDSDDHLFLFGKTMLPTHNSSIAAGIMLTAIIVNHRPSSEFLILAPTKEGADNAYKPIRDMINADPDLKNRFSVQEHLKTITDRLNKSTLKVVASDSSTVTGKKASGVFLDEIHQLALSPKAMHMITEATGGLASRPEGFVVMATTQGSEPPVGIFADKLSYARKVRNGQIVDKRFLPIIYEFPKSWIDAKKHLDLSNAWVTNPNWGLSVDEDIIRQKYQEATEAGEHAVRDFTAKHLNVQVSMALSGECWPGAEYWPDCKYPLPVTLERLLADCEVITIGVDAGGLSDLAAIAVLGRIKNTQNWLLWTKAYAHPSVLERHKQIASRLQDFAKDGDLVLVDRIGQDVESIADVCSQVYASGLLDRIGVDPAGIGSILEAIDAQEIPADRVIGISQGWRLNSAIKSTERKLAEGGLLHGGSAMMNWCAGNARVEARGNAILITKQSSGAGKIDPLIASFCAVSLMALNPQSAGEAYQMFVL
jgi:phage terminase large subunit-like protein